MKVNYFGYHIQHLATGDKYLIDLRKFFKAFCSCPNNKLKNRFRIGNENLYLLHQSGDLFLFIMTRSTEIIQKIDKQTLSVKDVRDLLKSGEGIGFASYVLIRDNYFGFGSTMLAPRVNAFCDYVSSIFDELGMNGHEFTATALLQQATKQEAVKMGFLGRTVIEVPVAHALGQRVLRFFSGSPVDYDDIGSIEVIVKPKPRKNIRRLAQKILNKTDLETADRVQIKARQNEAQGQIQELYLAGQGIVSDQIKLEDRKNVLHNMELAEKKNTGLKAKVKEFKQNDPFKTSLASLDPYRDVSAWTGRFPNT